MEETKNYWREKGERKKIQRYKKNYKKPKFLRQESWRYKRLETGWRKPKGIDSKMRVGKKGWPDIVKVGYRSPKKTRGIHPSGLKEILIFNSKNLEEIEPTEYAIKIAHTVGLRKKIIIREQAEQLGLLVLNPGISEEY